MEDIILKILNNGEINLLQVVFLLIVLLIILVKQRKTNEKIDLIGNNHLHSINEALQRIENKIENFEIEEDEQKQDIRFIFKKS